MNNTHANINRRFCTTAPLYQYDYGQVLVFTGVTLPMSFEVHFALKTGNGTMTVIGSNNQVAIPDELLQTSGDIKAYIYLHEGVSDGETEYVVAIPVKERPQPTQYTPTPVQQDVITQTIAALQDAVEHVDSIAEGLEGEIVTAVQDELATGKYKGDKGDKGDKGNKGDKGDDAYTILITNDAIAFPATSDGHAVAGITVYCRIFAYKGDTQIPTRVGGISSYTGLTITKSGDDTTNNRVTITTADTLTVRSGVISLSLVVDGKSFEKQISFSLIIDGTDGEKGDKGDTGEKGDTGYPTDAQVEVAVSDWLEEHPEVVVADGSITEPKINATLWDKLLVSEEATGNPASFSDGADDIPVKNLKVALNPVQNLHGYDNPWPAGGRVNLLNPADIVNLKYIKNTGDIENTTGWSVSGYVPVVSGTTYVLNITNSGTAAYHAFYDANKDFVSSIVSTTNPITIPTGIAFIRLSMKTLSNDPTTTAQFEIGTVSTAWTPYENICPIYPANGKNLIYPKYAGRTNNGITYTVNADGTITTSGTATGSSYAASNLSSQLELMQIVPEGTYTLTGGISANEIVYFGGKYIDESSLPPTYDRGSGVTFTLTKPAYLYPQIQITNGTSSNRTFYIQLERGSSASAYQPYQGITVERTGKNLLPDLQGVRATGSIYIGQTDGTTFPIHLSANKAYTISVTVNSGATGAQVYVKQNGGNNILFANLVNGQGTYTPSTDMDVQMWVYAVNLTSVSNFQLEYGTTATSYEPYVSPVSYPISLGREVYGGTVDLATGVLTVTHGIVDLGSLTWTQRPATPTAYYCAYNDAYMEPARVTTLSSALKSYPNTSNWNTVLSYGNGSVCIKDSGSPYITVVDTEVADADALKTKLNGVQLVYELAEPQTYQLTPTQVKTLLGYNNISSTGTVDVIYHADTKLYIDKRIAELG